MTMSRLFHVDSFASAPFTGNPAAVLVLDQEPDADLGPRIGAELNQPATAVVWPSGEAGRFGLRWFTATSELNLCGHGTLAAARVLLDAGRGAGGQVRFDTRSGPLEAQADGDGITLRFPSLRPGPMADAALAAAVTGVLAAPAGAEILSNDMDALVVLGSQAGVRDAQPDLESLARLPLRGLIITAPGDDGGADFVSRFFCPSVGIAEDAVTGSAHCALAPYWIERLGRQPLLGHQLSARGGRVRVAMDGTSVILTGQALVLSEGSWRGPAGPGSDSGGDAAVHRDDRAGDVRAGA